MKNMFWNGDEHRLRAIWRQIVQFVLFTILSQLFIAGVSVLFSPQYAKSSALWYASANPYVLELPLIELLTAVAALISIWLMARFINREPFSRFGFRLGRNWWLDCGFGLLVGFLLTTAIFLIELAAGWISITGTFYSGLTGVPFVVVILIPFLLFISAAFFEESSFRGYPIRNLSEGLKLRGTALWLAMIGIWVLSSVLFGWIHHANPGATPFGLINIGLAGILFGLSYMLTGSLALSIGIHIGWDFCQGCVYGNPVAGITPWRAASFITIAQHGPVLWTGGGFGPDGGILVTLAFLLGMLPIFLYVRWRYGKVAIDTSLNRFENSVGEGEVSLGNGGTAGL